MKYTLFFCILMTSVAWSKATINFNQALTEDVQNEIKNDEDKFKRPVMRGPASVGPGTVEEIKEPSKIDKNVRQIGHRNW